MKIKVCGLKHNIPQVADLKPDYLGFIFYDQSKRFITSEIPTLDEKISRVGVFVNSAITDILQKIDDYDLNVVQLHGDESTTFIKDLRSQLPSKKNISIWKVFSVSDSIDFNKLIPFQPLVDAFLFDTKGVHRGGNGKVFKWSSLAQYPFSTPFILSGGIGPEQIEEIQNMVASEFPILAVDVNSKFEISPGQKDIDRLEPFINRVRSM